MTVDEKKRVQEFYQFLCAYVTWTLRRVFEPDGVAPAPPQWFAPIIDVTHLSADLALLVYNASLLPMVSEFIECDKIYPELFRILDCRSLDFFIVDDGTMVCAMPSGLGYREICLPLLDLRRTTAIDCLLLLGEVCSCRVDQDIDRSDAITDFCREIEIRKCEFV